MSSVVKKSSQFAPKLKNKHVRRNKLPETPPATQVPAPSKDEPASSQTEPSVPTPPITQEQKPNDKNNNLLNYSIDNSPAKSIKVNLDSAVDPMDKSQKESAIADDSEDSEPEQRPDDQEDDIDPSNDIFAAPQAQQRRRSSVASRRLSGINSFRSGSFSAAGSVGLQGSEEKTGPPVTIDIPTSRPVKRRSSSSHHRHIKKSKETPIQLVVPPTNQVFREEDENAEEEAHNERVHLAEQDKDIVVGIDPILGKFCKYRKSEFVEGLDHLPVAPDNLVTSITSILQLPRRVSKEDERYFALIGVHAEQFTMAELCKPLLQIGSVSEKFEMAEAAKIKLRQKRDLRREARKKARAERISYEKALQELQDVHGVRVDGDEEKKKSVFQEQEEQSNSTSLKVKLIDGVLQVDNDSTVVSNQRNYDSNNKRVELENPFENPVTSNSYTKLVHTDAWTTDELIQFYNALSTWGTDFTFIAQLFPYRSRRQVKRKFILEEKRSPELVELALRRRLPPDFNAYCKSLSTDVNFKTLDEFHEEMENIKKEHELHLEEINTERERAIEEDLEANRKREMELRTGSKMTARERKEQLRRNEIVVGTVDDVKKPREELEKGA